MILEQQKNAAIIEVGDVNDSLNMSLDLDSAQILMQMLSKNLYSDAIGSTIRETCSNALDSHRRAKVNDPIVVSFKVNNDNTYSFTVEDFGIGLDANDVSTIISKYGKSTKRNSADELGMMGLGFKAPLAYSSSFHFVCRKNGMEWKYMMYEGEDTNKIDLLYQQPTSERNGVKIIIPVKYQDKQEFLHKIREQLAYFESVYFDTGNVSNDFTILRTPHYQMSPLVSVNDMHICLDNIYYPIDFEKLGISTINLPIGLRFGLSDGIFPTPNRESIRYTQEAKEIIKNKIKEVAEVIVTMHNATITNTTDINVIFNYYSSTSRIVDINGKSFDVNQIKKFATSSLAVPKLIGVDLLDLKNLSTIRDFMTNEYVVKYKIKNGKMMEIKSNEYNDVSARDINSTNYFVYETPISGTKREYIKSICGYATCYICKKVHNHELGFDRRNSMFTTNKSRLYYHNLELKKYPKNEWRQVIKEFQFIQDMFTDKFKNIDDIEIPQTWIDARKKDKVRKSMESNRRIKLTGELFGKTATPLERYVTGQNCKFVADTYQADKISKYKGFTVYDSYDNQSKLDNLYYISRVKEMNIRIISFSNRELKVANSLEIHNLTSYDKFMEGTNMPFKRLITAYLISKLITTYSNVFYKRDILQTISQSLVDNLHKLLEYKNKYFRYADNDIYESMLEVATEKMLFDMSIYPEYLDMFYLLKKLTFLEPVLKTVQTVPNYISSTESQPMIPVLIDLFKYYKHRIDYKNYKFTLNEILDLEALLLTDNKIEELVTNI